MNPTNLQIAQFQFIQNVAKLIEYIFDNNHLCTLGEAWRSKEQALLYAKQGKGIADSLHCKRLAIDLNLFDRNEKYLTDSKDYEQFGIYWESLHPDNRWGGRFKDKNGNPKPDGNHFQRNYDVAGKTMITHHECDGCCIPK